MSGRHARRKRLPALRVAVLAGACAIPFALHANTSAVADTVHVPSSPTLAPETSKPGVVGVQALERSARQIQREVAQERRERRIEISKEHESQQAQLLRERQQAARERASERAAQAERRALSRWVMPINGAGWSASFGASGTMWSSGYHTGQDFTAPAGTPVLAASGGTITFAGWSNAYGNKIEITHPDGNQTWYAHMSGFERASGTVRPGETIGHVGCTGNCYGNHLHFEFHPGGGEAADPVAWLRKQGAI